MLTKSPRPGYLPLEFRDKVFNCCRCHEKQWVELWDKRLKSRFALTPDGLWFLHPRITSGYLGKEKRRATRLKSEEEKAEPVANRALGPLAALWNEVCVKLPRVMASTSDRLARERVRLKERSLDEWRKVFVAVNASPFLCGETSSWRASFDWIVSNPRNASKVLEGNYEKGGGPKSPGSKSEAITENIENWIHGRTQP
jgi:hypothetical protein